MKAIKDFLKIAILLMIFWVMVVMVVQTFVPQMIIMPMVDGCSGIPI